MENFSFDLPKNRSSAIKVIGVGGGGTNAVNYMYEQGITGVDFVICNTDSQALKNSPIPIKIQLGVSITEGLGAGANPDIGEQSAIESIEEIKALFGSHTKMVFITAGMGGGTGTGAAPIIAGIAKELGILTVGIVTIPFFFEGKSRLEQAEKGLEKLRNNLDSLIVINNDKLRELYGNLGYKSGFAKADEVLSTAAKGIAEVITQNYTINIDLRDAKTVLSESGTAIMGSAKASGEGKAKEAIKNALDSPLLNDNKISGAKNVLLLILSGKEEITIDEIGIINDYIQTEAGNSANIIMGVGEDLELDEEISVTIVATGFPIDDQRYTGREEKKIVHTLKEDQAITKSLSLENSLFQAKSKIEDSTIIKFDLEEESNLQTPIAETPKNEEISLINSPNITDENEPKIDDELLFNEDSNEKKTEENSNTAEPTIFNLDDFNEENNSESSSFNFFDKEEIKPIIKSNTPPIEEYVLPNSTEDEIIPVSNSNINNDVEYEKKIDDSLNKKIEERRERLKQFNAKYNTFNNNNIEDLEKTPAFQRQGVHLDEQNQQKPKFYLDTEGEDIQIRPNNFLHDNVD